MTIAFINRSSCSALHVNLQRIRGDNNHVKPFSRDTLTKETGHTRGLLSMAQITGNQLNRKNALHKRIFISVSFTNFSSHFQWMNIKSAFSQAIFSVIKIEMLPFPTIKYVKS